MSSAKANWSRKIRRARHILRTQAKHPPERVQRAAGVLMAAKLSGDLTDKLFTHTHEGSDLTQAQDVAPCALEKRSVESDQAASRGSELS